MVRRLPSPPLMHDLPQNSCPQDRNSNQLQRPGTIAACMPQPWPISEQGNMRPPTTVPQTGTLSSSAGSTNRGSSSRIAKSARLPHSIEPSSVSSLRVNAAPMVTAYRAYASPIFEDCRGLGAGRCATDGRDRDLVVPGARSCGTGVTLDRHGLAAHRTGGCRSRRNIDWFERRSDIPQGVQTGTRRSDSADRPRGAKGRESFNRRKE